MDKAFLQIAEEALRNDPGGWRWSGFDLIHERLGIEVWLANDWYGLSVKFWGPRVDPVVGRAFHKIGGVTFMSTFFGRLIPWRRRIMKPAMQIKRRLNDAGTVAILDALEERARYG